MRFLIVDDDPSCRDLFRRILSPYAECDLAADGCQAIDAFRAALDSAEPYDLVLLDIMMPRADGHEVLDAIREIEASHGRYGSDWTKVVMATALADSKHCIRAFKEGCESYVTKPLNPRRLIEVVEKLLGSLPRRLQSQPEAAKKAACAAPSPQPVADKRFLVVDDDGVCRALAAAMLAPYGRCHFAYDGWEAVDAVRLSLEDGCPYDLILLDIMMPGMNGHDALSNIRQLETKHGAYGADSAKVIMTTALHDSKHCIQSFREGCEAYVTKPIDENDLLEKLQQLGLTAAAKTAAKA